MRAFQILLNGKRICVAGIQKDGVLSTTLTYVPFRKRRETRLYVGGLETEKNEHLFWKEAILQTGDELRVRIIETKSVDSPAQRYPRDRVAEAEAEKRHLRKLAKKFGWKIQESRKKNTELTAPPESTPGLHGKSETWRLVPTWEIPRLPGPSPEHVGILAFGRLGMSVRY